MGTSPKMTGRLRYRTHKPFLADPICIIQVEFVGTKITSCGGHIDSEVATWWIDARPQHLSMLSEGIFNVRRSSN